ncbi:hypothetical protein [[Clostridium] polysaccharolyticum]|uniref:Uncharacterized protein n=1 Tax=[Clostridium] polysaccharolyticum TaxID=29364 RepID=A0A1H9Y9B0_9FIRM|nr:hypothetical protein [[Clostridium] polysaccharolyticum]SES65359.1 hypothetical protein SAMN04487772_101223 [[Clostridium] polysaccharolyticum]
MKKNKIIIVAFIITVGFIWVFLFNSNSVRTGKDHSGNGIQVEVAKNESINADIKEQDKQEQHDGSSSKSDLHIDTYEELKKEKDVVNQKSRKVSGKSGSDTIEKAKTKVNKTKKIVIDESSTTMKDETIGTEKEYTAGEEPQKKIELHEPIVTEGKEVTIDTKPGGKRNIGTWG